MQSLKKQRFINKTTNNNLYKLNVTINLLLYTKYRNKKRGVKMEITKNQKKYILDLIKHDLVIYSLNNLNITKKEIKDLLKKIKEL